MRYDPARHHRRSIRLKGWDYAHPGWYYVNIVVRYRECHFGRVVNGKMELSPLGLVADACWREIPQHHPGVSLDDYIVMPNHLHGIVVINEKQHTDMKDDGEDVRGRDVDGKDVHGGDVHGRDVHCRDVDGMDVQGKDVDGKDVDCKDVQLNVLTVSPGAMNDPAGPPNMMNVLTVSPGAMNDPAGPPNMMNVLTVSPGAMNDPAVHANMMNVLTASPGAMNDPAGPPNRMNVPTGSPCAMNHPSANPDMTDVPTGDSDTMNHLARNPDITNVPTGSPCAMNDPTRDANAPSAPKTCENNDGCGTNKRMSPVRGSLSVIIRTFKAAVTTWAHNNGYGEFAWLGRFHDHIIRNNLELRRIRKYIRNNPRNWELDNEIPETGTR